MLPFDGEAAARAVIQVGAGRGFVIETRYPIPEEDQIRLAARQGNGPGQSEPVALS